VKVLVIGGGGREHALVWKISQSSMVKEIYCAPGNGGISQLAKCVDISATDIDGMVGFAVDNNIDLVVVAPDDPLVLGAIDRFEEKGIKAFGPSKAAAAIEGSKTFAKDLMKRYGIPTASYRVFDNFTDAKEFVTTSCPFPVVIKADGLALGKGVIIAKDQGEAIEALDSMMVKRIFNQAGERVVIEQFITGPEVSLLAFTDGETVLPMVSSQDHKRAYDNDEGPNTGGMGAFSPSPYYTDAIHKQVMDKIVHPTIRAMKQEGRPFKGVIYFGLMLTKEGPKVLEYNARFGDPETQVVLPRLKNDLVDIFLKIIDGKLKEVELKWDNRPAACIILASGGYPKAYQKGYEISGLDKIKDSDCMVFHAGTVYRDGKYYTNGGRVLGITAMGESLTKAVGKAYQMVEGVSFQNMHFRRDIGCK
jgi:phosphoribosylamine--glycine ligase